MNPYSDQRIREAFGAQLALNEYNQAVDGLTSALSYAKTWTPPEDIPEHHVSVEEFVRRAEMLLEIARRWR